MSAPPVALNQGTGPPPTPGPAVPLAPQAEPTSAPSPDSKPAPIWPAKGPRSGRKSAPKITRNGSLPIRRLSGGGRKTSVTQTGSRLAVAETTYKGKKAWRVSLGKRGRNLLSFRVRPSGSGFFVAWRSGNSERYVCYLSAAEWGPAKKGSSATFARLIGTKLDARRAAGEMLDKIAGLQDLVKAFA